MTKKAAEHLAKALYELDMACWFISSSDACNRKMATVRTQLSKLFTASGYEFARTDSTLIRKRRR